MATESKIDYVCTSCGAVTADRAALKCRKCSEEEQRENLALLKKSMGPRRALRETAASSIMTELALSFPTLRGADGVDPFDPVALDEWACSVASHGGVLAAQFVLAVFHGRAGRVGKRRKTPEKDAWFGAHRFNVDTHWHCGIFDIVDALGTWDHAHRAAFVSWVEDPFWP